MRTPSMVSEVSAMLVASTTLRRPAGGRGDGPVLFGRRQRAVERGDLGVLSDPAFQEGCDATDLALARQEGEDRAGIGPERPQDRLRHGVLDAAVGGAGVMAGLDREGPSLRFDHRRIAEQTCDAGAVEGRRHDEDAKVRPQRALCVEGERESEIGVEGALVELVEQHGADAGEFGIVEDHPGEHALGHDLDAGSGGDLGAEAHAQADRLPDGLTQALGHALGGPAGGEAAGLQDDDPGVRCQPWRVEECERNAGGLTRTRRRDEYGARRRREGRAQLRQDLVDGEAGAVIIRAHGSGWCDARRETARASGRAWTPGARPVQINRVASRICRSRSLVPANADSMEQVAHKTIVRPARLARTDRIGRHE